ncbi:MAG TPA: nucleotide exchange factor GrpE, partial [Saprospiraceae bacterium]|nr:nucleotide exchange factor GrpE [Saprospiraceae bacterium]
MNSSYSRFEFNSIDEVFVALLSQIDFDSFVEGLKLIYDKLLGVLEKNGVEKLDAVGKNFDPNFHE